MCGRYSFFDTEQLFERYDVPKIKGLKPHYNIAPSQKAPVVLDDGAKHVEIKRFGIPAPWDEKKRLINARAETVSEKNTFKKKLESQRCLIPSNGFFEWKRSDGKTPYYFHVKGMPIFSLAGIYSDDGFSILTTAANKVMEKVHHRMPVILDRDEEEGWINPDMDVDQILKLLDPFHGKLNLWEVSKLVNNPSNDERAVIEQIKI